MNSLIVGFGKMGMLHASILNSLEGAGTLAVSESSAFIRDGLKTMNPRIPVYGSYQEALESQRFDLAVIATPNDSHFDIFKNLFEKNISVFIEKPFVTSFTEAQKALDLVKSKKENTSKIMVGHCLRFVPAFEKTKELLTRGAVGKILHFDARMYSSDVETSQTGWRFDAANKGGGVLLDLGSHLIDLTRFLFGMPVNVTGHTERWFSAHVEDFFHAVFHYGVFSGTVEASWSMPGVRKPAPEIVVTGENGRLSVSNDYLELDLKAAAAGCSAGLTKYDATHFSTPVPFDLAGPFYTRQWMEFTQAIKTNTPNRNDIQEAVDNHRLIDAIRSSHRTPVSIEGGYT